MVAVSCAAGVLIDVAEPSSLVGAIIVIYEGNQISILPLAPTILNISNTKLFTSALATLTACLLLTAAVGLFEKKQF